MVSLNKMRMLIKYERRLRRRYCEKWGKATKTTAIISGMPRGTGTKSQTENGAIDLAEIEEVYQEVFSELSKMREDLTKLIQQLDNPDDIAVMRLRYIHGYDVKEIPEAIYMSERAMFYHLARAEEQLIRNYPDKVCK